MSKGPKTVDDFLALPDDLRIELVEGEIVEKAGPTFGHSCSQGLVAAFLNRRFQRPPGGRWPGGWIIGTEVDVEYGRHDLFCHDVAGWRRERMPEPTNTRPQRLRPEWVCEVLSPSTARRDRLEKFRVLQSAGVPHLWLIDPEDQVLFVHRLEASGYVIVLTAKAGETVRAEPFDAVELRAGVLFGEPDDD